MNSILEKLKLNKINKDDNEDDDHDKINKKDVFSGLSNLVSILMGIVFVMSLFYFLYGLTKNNFGIVNKVKN
jgi:hypothetical protein